LSSLHEEQDGVICLTPLAHEIPPAFLFYVNSLQKQGIANQIKMTKNLPTPKSAKAILAN
jgi:hypothetical protein